MYGSPALPLVGVAVLPATGNSKPLFVLAASLIATGVVIMIASFVVARKSRTSEAN